MRSRVGAPRADPARRVTAPARAPRDARIDEREVIHRLCENIGDGEVTHARGLDDRGERDDAHGDWLVGIRGEGRDGREFIARLDKRTPHVIGTDCRPPAHRDHGSHPEHRIRGSPSSSEI